MNTKNIKIFAALSVILLLFTYYVGTPYMTIAALNYVFILAGFLMRKKNRMLHVRFVSLGILSDLCLVLILQYQRDAIGTAISFKLSFLNQAHIFSSLVATLLYIPMAITGAMILKKEKLKNWHQKFGYMVITFRTLGLILMYSMIDSLKDKLQ